MRRIAGAMTVLVLLLTTVAPADAATARIGGPCKKLHQVDWITGVRAQCTWIPAGHGKKGRAIWKRLPPAKTTATAAELGLVPPTPAPEPTSSADPTQATPPAGAETAK
jgi:hypothetical protein